MLLLICFTMQLCQLKFMSLSLYRYQHRCRSQISNTAVFLCVFLCAYQFYVHINIYAVNINICHSLNLLGVQLISSFHLHSLVLHHLLYLSCVSETLHVHASWGL